MYERTIYIEEICFQYHTIWSLRKLLSHYDVFIISHTTKVGIHCLPMIFVDAKNLVQIIHKRWHVYHCCN